jgi:hypothetical protein
LVSDSSLSTGAKAGIGVGAGVGGLVFIGVIALIVLQRRRRRDSSALQGFGELRTLSAGNRRVELPGDRSDKIELFGTSPASEVEGSSVVAELH